MREIIMLACLGFAVMGSVPVLAQQRGEAVPVVVDDLQSTPYGVSVTLRSDRTGELLHMMIGQSEGEAIARALRRRATPRPMTHDLMKTILDRTGWRVQRVVIRGVSGTTYLADLVLERGGATEVIDCRPSDAMALAVRSDAKIYVNPEVFEVQREFERQQEPEPQAAPDDSIRL